MEIQLQELIDRIKKDGAEAAETEAKAIIDSAKAEAEKIISDAKVKADKILLDAKTENEKMVKSSEDTIRQAGRNVLISFRESVARELAALINKSVNNVYSSEDFTDLIVKTVESWAKNPDADDLSVILNTDDLMKLEKTLIAKLNAHLSSGVTLKSNDNFDGGFRIAVNGGKAYYDYSAEAVTDMLSNYLSDKVTTLLKEAE